MSQETILYDLPSQVPCRSWSGNVWKTRLALNFKDVPYKTEWTPYTRLEGTLRALGLKPNPPCSWADYTVPVVRFSDGSTWMDSAVIANELESRYPEPSLRLNPNLEKEAQGAMGEVFMSLVPYLLPLSAQIVALEDMNWFKEDRAKRFGMTVDEAFHTHKDGSSYFEAAKPGFEKVVQVLKAHKIDQGPFILGSQPCYADFYLVATLQMFSQIGEEGYEEFIKYAPAELRQLHEACREWTVRQD